MIKSIPIKEGEKYTVYSLSGMATTSRREIIVTSTLETPEFRKSYTSEQPSVYGNWRLGAYREQRKRKQYHLDIKADRDLILNGWNHLLTDAEAYNCYCGNACLNLAGTVEDVKGVIYRNINNNFSNHDILLAYPEPHVDMPDHDGIMVYPEHPTSHAVILRTRENLATRNKLIEQKGSITCA
jgi:hypothetical protein